MPYRTRPYVLRIVGDSTTGWRRRCELTARQGKQQAASFGLGPVSRRTPRVSRSHPGGEYVEFRYVDPRPGAPRCITPAAQED